MAGAIRQPIPGVGVSGPTPVKPPSIFDVYGGSLKQTGEDYDSLMGNYRNLLGSTQSNGTQPLNFTPNNASLNFTPISSASPTNMMEGFNPITPNTASYGPSGDVNAALGFQRNLAETGGYTDANQADIRARGISPIRSVYANAQRGLDRQKSLQGGYSPGYAAATAKMARELSDQIAGQVTNVNAGLAQSIVANKAEGANALANTASGEANRALDVSKFNTNSINDTNRFNASSVMDTNRANASIAEQNANRTADTNRINSNNALDVQKTNAQIAQDNANRQLTVQQSNQANSQATQARLLEIMKSMQSLYGTTPGLANTFGQQALAANQQNINVAQNNNQKPIVNPLLSKLPSLGGISLGMAS